MSGYIDTDVLIKKYGDWYVEDSTGEGFIGNMRAFVYDVVPTVDAVEVVRCKDCKYRDKHHDCNNLAFGYIRCSVPDDWFCADGKRKETEDGKSK